MPVYERQIGGDGKVRVPDSHQGDTAAIVIKDTGMVLDYKQVDGEGYVEASEEIAGEEVQLVIPDEGYAEPT